MVLITSSYSGSSNSSSSNNSSSNSLFVCFDYLTSYKL